MAHSASPALHANDGIAFVKHAELDCVHDTPLQATVNILLPWAGVEVRLRFGEVERVHASVQV